MADGYNFFDEMIEIRREYTGDERTVEEVRYRDGAQWFRADDTANDLLGIFTPIVERRTLRQRRVRDTYPDGHTVEGWETAEE